MNDCVKTFTNGIIKNNPVLVSLLGMCPMLAVTTTLVNGLAMGIATTFVLICSNIAISLLKNVIPEQVQLPCYIIIIAGFVTFVERIIEVYMPSVNDRLGLFLSLIAVNCIVFARAKAFACKNNPFKSMLDGAGMGLGFTFALLIISSIREILGSGTLLSGTDFVIELPIFSTAPIGLFISAAGGFFVVGVAIAAVGKIMKKPVREAGCSACPSRSMCSLKSDDTAESSEETE